MHDAEEVPIVTATTPDPPPAPTALEQPSTGGDAPRPTGVIEAIFDNLSFWTLICAAIGLLYLVWATLEILSRYVGRVPSLTP